MRGVLMINDPLYDPNRNPNPGHNRNQATWTRIEALR